MKLEKAIRREVGVIETTLLQVIKMIYINFKGFPQLQLNRKQ